ncbi:Kinesin- protein 12 [Blomia tropicalis]|nr:Kinesin- protein 12 [Blomia tropicalis]
MCVVFVVVAAVVDPMDTNQQFPNMIGDQFDERDSSDSFAYGMGGNHGPDHSINVVIRVRPIISGQTSAQHAGKSIATKTNSKENGTTTNDPSTAISFPAAGQIQVQDVIASTVRPFAFNVVFEPEATQEEVFEHSGVKRLIDMALDGFACTVFAYGQTSTGKTYTLTGNAFQTEMERMETMSPNKRRHHTTPGSNCVNHQNLNSNNAKSIGIVQLSFAYLFEQIKRRKLRDKTLYVITVSYLEVYNEQVLDLLNPSPRSLNVRWAKDRGFYAENLFKVECEDIGDLEGVLEEGCKNRQVRGHSMNENSSRSHAVMTITLSSEMSDPEDPQGFIRKEGRLCLVDLAGSEKTKRTNSKGGTFVEANNINRSLLVLGNCIACLADPKRRNGHIPYRDSMLTKLLADSLAGNGMTLMIACVSPMKCDSQETISTLRYASRAKRVRMNPVVQMLNENGTFDANSMLLSRMENMGPNGAIDKVDDKDGHLLNKYMHDNEVLRVENVQLNLQRHRLIRDHELVCKENERLMRKLNSLIGKSETSSGNRNRQLIGSAHLLTSLSSSASSPSLLSLVSPEDTTTAVDESTTQVSHNVNNVSNHAIISTTTSSSNHHESRPQSVQQSKPKEEQNDLILVREKPNSTTNRIRHSNTRNSETEESNTLDLTIRGKSAVNGGRIQQQGNNVRQRKT